MTRRYSKTGLIRCMMEQYFPYIVSINNNLEIISAINYYGEYLTSPIKMPNIYANEGVKTFDWKRGSLSDEVLESDLYFYNNYNAPWVPKDSAPYGQNTLKRYVLLLQAFSHHFSGAHFLFNTQKTPRKVLDKAVRESCKYHNITMNRHLNMFSLEAFPPNNYRKYYYVFVEMEAKIIQDFKQTVFENEVSYKLQYV